MTGNNENKGKTLGEKVGEKEQRKIRGRKLKNKYSVYFGLGMFGLVGWSVAVPAILFTVIGVWVDSVTGGNVSWTLTFLFGGVVLGCLNAWRWVKKESGRE